MREGKLSTSSSASIVPTGQSAFPRKNRRKMIPEKPNYSINLWSIMKNCIGKELSKIPMPVSSPLCLMIM
jgi:hypothetical protein